MLSQISPKPKTAAVVNLVDPVERQKLVEFLHRDRSYGYNSPHVAGPLDAQRIESAVDALKKGRLHLAPDTDPGLQPFRTTHLSEADLRLLDMELLKETPNRDIINALAERYGVDPLMIQREYLQARLSRIRDNTNQPLAGKLKSSVMEKVVKSILPTDLLMMATMLPVPKLDSYGARPMNRLQPLPQTMVDAHNQGEQRNPSPLDKLSPIEKVVGALLLYKLMK